MSENISASLAPAHKPAHPSVFFFLSLPYGITTGYVTVTFAYLYSQAGISTIAIAALVGSSLLPNIFKFLWAPLVDTTLTLKKWYILTTILTSAGILVSGLLPVKESSLPLLNIVVFITNFLVSFTYMSATGLAAHDTPHELKGKVGGYSQAGNVGGTGLGGGAGLWLAQHFQAVWVAPVVVSIGCAFTCFALFYIREPLSTVKSEKVSDTLKNLLKDIWSTINTRLGLLALFLCFLPLGTGAAQNLWAAVADDWHAGPDTVALVTGVVSGIITTVGCLIGGWICDRTDRKIAYIIFGILNALCTVLMAYSPHTEMMYIIWTSIYAFFLGFCFAAFTAFVLEAIGKGAAGTKYTLYGGLSNIPIWYMTIMEGFAHDHYGPVGMLITEALGAVLAVVLFFAFLKFINSRTSLT